MSYLIGLIGLIGNGAGRNGSGPIGTCQLSRFRDLGFAYKFVPSEEHREICPHDLNFLCYCGN